MSGGRARAGPEGARRLVRAVLAIALVAAAVAAAGGAGSLVGSDVLREALREASDYASASEAELPGGFEEEVLAVAGRAEMRADARAGLVGFTTRASAEESFAAIAKELAARGWRSVESGMPSCGTFAKEGGRHRWLFVSCVQTGEGASVVVQCEALADERS